jgi:hypothetical protein
LSEHRGRLRLPAVPRIEAALTNDQAVEAERAIRRKVVSGLDAVLLRTPDRAWFERLPSLAAGHAVPTIQRGRPDRRDRRRDARPDGRRRSGTEVGRRRVIALDTGDRAAESSMASRFAQLSPQEAEEVERALSGALTLLQKVSDILDQQSDREAPAVSGLRASVRSLRDARSAQGKR